MHNKEISVLFKYTWNYKKAITELQRKCLVNLRI